jgi:hypothetical protein
MDHLCSFILVILLAIIIGGGIWARNHEKKSWNTGKCTVCDSPLYHYDMDSQGGRGYACSVSHMKHPSIWVSYDVDKFPVLKTNAQTT